MARASAIDIQPKLKAWLEQMLETNNEQLKAWLQQAPATNNQKPPACFEQMQYTKQPKTLGMARAKART